MGKYETITYIKRILPKYMKDKNGNCNDDDDDDEDISLSLITYHHAQ